LLVIKRRPQESLWINDDIHIKVLAVGHSRVTLGVTAPTSARILREELIGRPGHESPACLPTVE